MSDRATPKTDEQEGMDNGDTVPLLDFARKLERQRDEARDLARELLDALENCREDSVELLGEWDWKRNAGSRNGAKYQEIEQRISVADSVIDKAKEVLP
jgi:hypothetical protein